MKDFPFVVDKISLFGLLFISEGYYLEKIFKIQHSCGKLSKISKKCFRQKTIPVQTKLRVTFTFYSCLLAVRSEVWGTSDYQRSLNGRRLDIRYWAQASHTDTGQPILWAGQAAVDRENHQCTHQCAETKKNCTQRNTNTNTNTSKIVNMNIRYWAQATNIVSWPSGGW